MKHNFNKIPKNILNKINILKSENVIVSCAKKIKKEEMEKGDYKHVGLVYKDGNVVSVQSIIPNKSGGKYSTRNVEGQEIIRKDLPKESKTFSFEAPDWGDWSNGSHEVDWTRDVYIREFIPPKELQINIELIQKNSDDSCIFKFTIDEVLNVKDKNFYEDLLFNINLLQENLESVDVFKSDATRADYLKTIFINWEILPPGERDEVIDLIISKFKNPTKNIIETIHDRYDFLSSLNPVVYIMGTSGFRRYFGAKLKDNFIIFENLEYGNAIYVMFDNWEELSKLNRLELLKNKIKHNFIRIIHVTGWKDELRKIIKEKIK